MDDSKLVFESLSHVKVQPPPDIDIKGDFVEIVHGKGVKYWIDLDRTGTPVKLLGWVIRSAASGGSTGGRRCSPEYAGSPRRRC